MKKIYYALLACILFFPACNKTEKNLLLLGGSGNSVVSAVSGYTFLGGTGSDRANSVQQTSDGGYIVAGQADADIPTLQTKTPLNAWSASGDMFVVKLNSYGAVDWYTFLGGAGGEIAESIEQTSDGGYIVAGSANADIPTLQGKSPLNAYTVAGGTEMLVVKLNTYGAVSWYTFLGGTGSDRANSVQQTSDGGYIVAGQADADIPTLQTKTPLNAWSALNDMLVIKLNKSGAVDWCTFLGGTGSDSASSIRQTSDGGFIVAGLATATIPTLQTKTPLNAYSVAGGIEMLIVKLNSSGAVSWYTFLGGTGSDFASSIRQISDGGFIVAGTASATIPTLQTKTPLNAYTVIGGSEMLIVKLNSYGAVDWYTFLGGSGTVEANSIQQVSNGGFIVAGTASATIATLQGKTPLVAYTAGDEMLIVDLNSSGAVDWYTFFGGSGTDEANSIQQTSDGGFIIAGSANVNTATLRGELPANTFAGGGNDMLVIKLLPDGLFNLW